MLSLFEGAHSLGEGGICMYPLSTFGNSQTHPCPKSHPMSAVLVTCRWETQLKEGNHNIWWATFRVLLTLCGSLAYVGWATPVKLLLWQSNPVIENTEVEIPVSQLLYLVEDSDHTCLESHKHGPFWKFLWWRFLSPPFEWKLDWHNYVMSISDKLSIRKINDWKDKETSEVTNLLFLLLDALMNPIKHNYGINNSSSSYKLKNC